LLALLACCSPGLLIDDETELDAFVAVLLVAVL
jgi:hypothetical protein